MRLEGWESRLHAIIEEARDRPYVLGEWDCFSMSCKTIHALLGIDRWPEFAGYKTRREAMARLAQYGSSFEKAGNWFFGSPHVAWQLAHRGDVACIEDIEEGDKHLGIVIGDRIAFLSSEGLVFLPIDSALCVWKVG